MTRAVGIIALVLATASAAGGAGYWLARQQQSPAPEQPHQAAQLPPPGERRVLYYKDPMGKPDYSPSPKKDAIGMDYIAVYEEAGPSAVSVDQQHDASALARPALPARSGTVLYYRNPMGLADTSPVPKKDSMGMDYIPVYSDEVNSGGPPGTVKISVERVQRLGVRTEAAGRRSLNRPIRAVGTTQFDERRVGVISPKFEGWIETLLVKATGERVRRGQPLMRVFSHELLQGQMEYILAMNRLKSMGDVDEQTRAAAQGLADGALQRLQTLNVPEDELQRLQRELAASRQVIVRSPFEGIVLEKSAFQGIRFMPGETLYRIVDTSSMWLIAEVFEQDLAGVQVGQSAKITLKAYPGRTFTGRVTLIYPAVGQQTRTAKVRIEIPNANSELKADMYADVEIAVPVAARDVLTVPDSAVIDSGIRQVVLIDLGEGRFEPRAVRLGARTQGYAEVLEGVRAGERVVVSANFLIDAESNLKSALESFSEPGHQHQ